MLQWKRLLMACVISTLMWVVLVGHSFAQDEGTIGVAQVGPAIPIRVSTTEFWYDNGFAKLAEKANEKVGSPTSHERPGDEPGSVIQLTTTGLLYYRGPGNPVAWTNGFDRLALTDDRGLVDWQSIDVPDPPAPIHEKFSPGVISPPQYIATHSRYGQRAVCVSRIETGNWAAYWNPTPVGREHAQGYFGWLPSTFFSVAPPGGSIMNLDDEIQAFDTMIDRRRGKEFYGISAGIC